MTPLWRAKTILLAAMMLVWLSPVAASEAGQASESAQPTSDTQLFTQATKSVERGAFSDAIAHFEQLSDRGFFHPDNSFNRAVAYLQRAESPKQRPGDFGQAAAGFREASLLARHDEESEQLLAAVRREISRLRSRQGLDPVVVQPTLGRALVNLVPETVWAILAALGSLALSVGLMLVRSTHTQRRLTGQVLGYTGGATLLLFGALTWASMHYRTTSQEAIVVAPQTRLLDETGNPLKATALDIPAEAAPEGASVFVVGQRGRLLEISWGSLDAWVRRGDLRPIGKPVELSRQF